MKYYHIEVTVKSVTSQVEFEFDLSFDELRQRFLYPYAMGNAIVVNGRTVQIDHLEQIRISSSDDNSETINSHLRYEQQQKRSFSMVNVATGRLADSLLFERATDVTREFITGPPGYELEEGNPAIRQPRSTTSIKVFISHSDRDVEIAKLLVELLRNALHLRSNDIRCTSLDGYRMQGGASIDERLRSEVHDAELLIGLITPTSLRSAYVIFELGARWGAEKSMIPLLASGATPEDLEGPLSGINALDSNVDGQVHQLLEDTAKYLHLSLDTASSYAATVNELVRVASESTAVEERLPITSEHPQLSAEARKLLTEAVKSSARAIMKANAAGGLIIQANGQNLCKRGDPRSEAIWEGALKDLIAIGFVEDKKGKGEVFVVTLEGFQAADKFEASQ